MTIDRELLHIPVDLDDMNDQREQIENVLYVQRDLFDRERFTHQGDTPVSQELWAIHFLLSEALRRTIALTNTEKFPPGSEDPKPM